ncbi:hypothetical protein EMCRGX_G014679 [Ephydatia muelleri]
MLIGTPKCLASVGKQRQAINSMLQLLDKPENIDLAEQLELANFGDDHDADSLFLELVLWNNVMASSRLFADCLIVLSKDPILYQELSGPSCNRTGKQSQGWTAEAERAQPVPQGKSRKEGRECDKPLQGSMLCHHKEELKDVVSVKMKSLTAKKSQFERCFTSQIPPLANRAR